MSRPPEAMYSPNTLNTLIGQGVDAIDTPALVVDLDAMERNLQRMAQFAQQHRMRWRPHAKMHKSAQIGLMQMQAGAVGVCVQKTAEAEAMAAGGVNDIHISNEVIAPHKLARVVALARQLQSRGGRLGIAVDSEQGVQALADAVRAIGPAAAMSSAPLIDVYVEVDVGHGRCGIPPAQAGALAQRVASHAGLRLAGLQAYQGRAQHLRSMQERRDAIAAAADAVAQARTAIEALGLPVPCVTGAGTGTMVHESATGAWHELQVGSFLFMDADYRRNERDAGQPPFEPALFVKSQVTGRYPQHAVCDAGHKSHAIDSGMPEVHWPAGLDYFSGGDEHGVLRVRSGGPANAGDSALPALPAIGDIVWLIPGHCDPTVNLHDAMIGVRGGLQGGVVERIIPVDARGALT